MRSLLQIVFKLTELHSDLPPSQGGKYSGFGYTKETPPRSQSQEFVDTALSSLASVSLATLYLWVLFELFCRDGRSCRPRQLK